MPGGARTSYTPEVHGLPYRLVRLLYSCPAPCCATHHPPLEVGGLLLAHRARNRSRAPSSLLRTSPAVRPRAKAGPDISGTGLPSMSPSEQLFQIITSANRRQTIQESNASTGHRHRTIQDHHQVNQSSPTIALHRSPPSSITVIHHHYSLIIFHSNHHPLPTTPHPPIELLG